jgi:hypothetical protein
VALPGNKFESIVWLVAGCNGMGAVMAAFTVNATVTFRHAVQRLILLERTPVAGSVIAPRFIQPGIWILGNRLH